MKPAARKEQRKLSNATASPLHASIVTCMAWVRALASILNWNCTCCAILHNQTASHRACNVSRRADTNRCRHLYFAPPTAVSHECFFSHADKKKASFSSRIINLALIPFQREIKLFQLNTFNFSWNDISFQQDY